VVIFSGIAFAAWVATEEAMSAATQAQAKAVNARRSRME
jgi:hypothetical protein